ncbi:hypothetical protein CLTEP_18840 [Clostridium tepidiprofundi DSM 19306]|uniref:Tetratricopeptide repeat protein n=1 Tax=Clostridium tepidiprofundi DSM 19306 TaxID=1121338 RepID=A0A151B302_9CLOT|nr:hypothetical protein [Clostridium tepidiprofundi]KYH34170.1 hypothetical protein CLTEP_18840 [Clostridium tepidiprofundi DSM 19306]
MDTNLQKINEIIQMGYTKLEEENVKDACTIWMKAWESLKRVIHVKKFTSIEEIDDEFEGYESLENWCQDFEMELENAASLNKEFYKIRIRYCMEFYNLLPDSDEFIILNMKLAEAESYFEIGSIMTSEKIFESAAEEFNDYAWVYIKWGDVYWLSNILKKQRELIDFDKAEKIYREGLNKGLEDEYILEDRLNDLLEAKEKLSLK